MGIAFRSTVWATPLAVLTAVLLAALTGSGGCGGGSPGSRPPADGGGMDTRDGDAGRPPGVECPPAAPGEKRGLGACCTEAAGCADGVCWNGFCTRTCAAAADCAGAIATPSPLPSGATMKCAANALGDSFSYCLPGSLTACAPSGGTCPAGEGCALGLDPEATRPGPAAYRGLCLTRLVAGRYQPVGSTCDASTGPYECEDQGGYLGNACFGRRCTRACRGNADCPVGMACGAPPFSAVQGGATASAPSPGICLGVVCGDVHGEAGLMVGQVTRQGADRICPAGELCLPSVATGASGDTLHLACTPPGAGAVPYSTPCSTEAGSPARCADDALCVTRGANRFCSALCRVDADCPADSVCLEEYLTASLPYGAPARLAMCTPRGLVPGRTCAAEKDCAGGGAPQACKPVGTRTQLLTCQPAAGSRPVGQDCDRPTDCVSGACYDRDLQEPTGGNRTLCGGFCRKNSDCGTRQICQRGVLNSNTTAEDPTDDVILGTCTPLTGVPRQGACRTDADCASQTAQDEIGGDACDTALGTCYRRGARVGAACTRRAQCPLGAHCRVGDPRFEGGACLVSGCDAAAAGSGADTCPAGAVCVQRDPDVPLWSCYEACPEGGGACARAAEGYVCLPPRTGEPANICASQAGT